MSDGPVPWPTDGLGGRLWHAWVSHETIGRRQLPLTILVPVVVAILLVAVDSSSPALLLTAVGLALAVQLVAILGRWDRWPPAWQYALPLGQILAVGLIDLGVGRPVIGLDPLLLFPAGSLALRPGGTGLRLALAGSALVVFTPTVAGLGVWNAALVLQAVIMFLVIAMVALSGHAIVEFSRRQKYELQRAHDELSVLAQQLRNSRDLLQSVWVAATEQAFVATDADGVILSASTGAERIFGRSRDALVGSDVTRLIVSDADTVTEPGPALRALVGSAAEGGTHIQEIPHVLADGSPRQLELVVTPRPELEGSDPELPAGYLLVATDITARYEEERRQDEFIGLVTHELRTPLSSILGYLELIRLEDPGFNDAQRRYLDVVERNANRLRSLVDDLLASAQLALGVAAVPEELDVVEVVQAAVASQRPMAEASGVAIEVTGDRVVPLVSDGVRLGQVVDNLLSNAVKYSLAGGRVVVTVTADATSDGGRAGRIRVVDEGTGIERDELARLTERFYRSRDTRRRRVRGMGLGLSLVQTVVDEHAGTLTIDSEPGAGTTVEVIVPDLPRGQEPHG